MTRAPEKVVIALAVFLAVGLHALLFVMARPTTGLELAGVRVPPSTRYLPRGGARPSTYGDDARVVGSPVLFSLPSRVGFSGEFLEQRVQTPRLKLNQRDPEIYLEVSAGEAESGSVLRGDELTLNPTGRGALPAPGALATDGGSRPSARRVTLTPELKERVVGGIVLPPELNKEVEKPWEATATVSVSGDGLVEHVFLDKPLQSPELNQKVLQLIHGLRFKPGKPIEGAVEVYSPETMVRDAEEPKS